MHLKAFPAERPALVVLSHSRLFFAICNIFFEVVLQIITACYTFVSKLNTCVKNHANAPTNFSSVGRKARNLRIYPLGKRERIQSIQKDILPGNGAKRTNRDPATRLRVVPTIRTRKRIHHPPPQNPRSIYHTGFTAGMKHKTDTYRRANEPGAGQCGNPTRAALERFRSPHTARKRI